MRVGTRRVSSDVVIEKAFRPTASSLLPVLLKKSNTFKASTRCSLRRVSARTSLAKDVRTLCTTLVRLVKLQGTRFAGATSIEKSDAARSPVPPHYMAALWRFEAIQRQIKIRRKDVK